MGKLFNGGDYEEVRQALLANRVDGGFVTPGAGVNVNVAPLLASFPDGTAVESAGATNLATAAPAGAGDSKVYSIVVAKADGTVSAQAGADAVTGQEVAPVVDTTAYALVANVTVANGAANVAQADISNAVRNLI